MILYPGPAEAGQYGDKDDACSTADQPRGGAKQTARWAKPNLRPVSLRRSCVDGLKLSKGSRRREKRPRIAPMRLRRRWRPSGYTAPKAVVPTSSDKTRRTLIHQSLRCGSGRANHYCDIHRGTMVGRFCVQSRDRLIKCTVGAAKGRPS